MRQGAMLVVGILCVLAVTAGAGDKHPCTADPEECVRKIAAQCQHMGWLGIEFDAKKGSNHFVITKVSRSSPAEAAGFEAGDVLLAINGAKVSTDNKEALKKMKALGSGAEVTFVVKRPSGKTELVATLTAVPDAVVARWTEDHWARHHSGAAKG